MIAYATITATAGMGYFGAPWWSLLFGAGALAYLAHLELRALGPRFSAVGALYMLEAATHARVGHSLLAASAAYGWGALVRIALGS
jgi:hypothetical protein